MSIAHQHYLTENRSDTVLNYTARNNIEYVHTYANEGKSDLNIRGLER